MKKRYVHRSVSKAASWILDNQLLFIGFLFVFCLAYITHTQFSAFERFSVDG